MSLYQCEKCGSIFTSDVEHKHHMNRHAGAEKRTKARLTQPPLPDIQPPVQDRDPKNLYHR